MQAQVGLSVDTDLWTMLEAMKRRSAFDDLLMLLDMAVS